MKALQNAQKDLIIQPYPREKRSLLAAGRKPSSRASS